MKRTECRRCGVRLTLAGCECWIDDRGTRYCTTGELHDPARSIQPARCGRIGAAPA